MAVSQKDGFFSAGKNQGNGEAAIAKLSTCAKFRIIVDDPTAVTYQGQSGTYNFPGRTVGFDGNNGAVTVSWILEDITQGGPATDISSPVSGNGNIPARTFTLSSGKGFAMLRYTITAVDSYTTDGIPQTCPQTAAILIKIYREFPDNIIEADCYVQPPEFEWSIKQDFISTETNLSTYMIPVAGDITGDGIPEIVVAKYSSDSFPARLFNGFYVYWGHDRNNPTLINTKSGNFCSFGPAIVRINISGVITPVVVMVEHSTGIIHAYNARTGAYLWYSDTPVYGFTTSYSVGYALQFVDFNSDGIIELVAGNHIYDAATGTMLLDLGSAANKGYSLHAGGLSYQKYVPAVADLNNDGQPEYAAGNIVYSINITNNGGTTDNTFSTMASIPAQTFNSLSMTDGTTLLADFNHDGRLDVFASRSMDATTIGFFAWDVSTQSVIAKGSTSSSTWSHGMPFVGNVDSDPELEILFVTVNLIKGFRYNSNNATFEQVYEHTVNDGSGATGITLFDFNQDNKSELVYRDEQNLRIMQAVPQTAPTMGTFSNLKTISGGSGTCYEYPIVVDTDNDGSAEIITVAGNGAQTQESLRIYKGDTQKWTSARKVWNQYMYNVVNINEDLTIPAYPLSPATFFAGKDKILDGVNDIQPYNNFLQQQTALSQDGVPFWLAPDAEFDGAPALNYYADGDSLVVAVQVKNSGDAGLQAPFYVAVMEKVANDTFFIANGSTTKTIISGDVETVTIRIPDFSIYSPFDMLIVKLNSPDGYYYDQTECDSIDNRMAFGANELLMAHNDHAATIAVLLPVKIDVLANDSIPGGCTPTVSVVTPNTSHGAAEIKNDSVLYTVTDAGFVGYDTVAYSLACNGNTSVAKVIIAVSKTPDNIIEADCYTTPPQTVWSITKLKETPGGYPVSTLGMVYAGDIDDDGHVEILAVSRNASDTYGYINETTLYVFDDNLNIKYTIALGTNVNVNPISNAISIADVDGDGYAEIFVCTVDGTSSSPTGGTLRRYSINTEKTNFVANGNIQHTTDATYAYCQPIITDFNGDGIPEVLVLDKVYNARTLTLLVNGGMKGNEHLGFGAGHSTSTSSSTFRQTRMIAVGDIDNDGLPEAIAGGVAYKVQITNTAGTGGNSFTVHKRVNSAGRSEVGDGATALADMDMDGYLDVIVSRRTRSDNNNSNRGAIYIWNPRTGKIMNTNVINDLLLWTSTYGPCGPSIPFIGDIDGDGKPEVIVVSKNR